MWQASRLVRVDALWQEVVEALVVLESTSLVIGLCPQPFTSPTYPNTFGCECFVG